MVLESLFGTERLMNSKFLLFLYTAIITLISVIMAVIFYPDSASVLSIAFITIAFVYFMTTVLVKTEQEVLTHETSFFKRYFFVVEMYVKIFIIVSATFTLLFVFLPNNYKDLVFTEQVKIIGNVDSLRSAITIGNFSLSDPAGLFSYIFMNNLGVLLALLLFSFLYGAGSLFINIFQASVFGTIVGAKILSLVPSFATEGVSGQMLAIFHGTFLGFGMLPHGAFELLAYFMAAVIGGIVSAILRGHYVNVRTHLGRIIFDLVIMLVVAVVLLAIGAWIESYLILG